MLQAAPVAAPVTPPAAIPVSSGDFVLVGGGVALGALLGWGIQALLGGSGAVGPLIGAAAGGYVGYGFDSSIRNF